MSRPPKPSVVRWKRRLEPSSAQIASYRLDRKTDDLLARIPELFGDVLVYAGYFWGISTAWTWRFRTLFQNSRRCFRNVRGLPVSSSVYGTYSGNCGSAIHVEDREAALRAFWRGVRSGQGFAMEIHTQ
jgi:hypothetical protein